MSKAGVIHSNLFPHNYAVSDSLTPRQIACRISREKNSRGWQPRTLLIGRRRPPPLRNHPTEDLRRGAGCLVLDYQKFGHLILALGANVRDRVLHRQCGVQSRSGHRRRNVKWKKSRERCYVQVTVGLHGSMYDEEVLRELWSNENRLRRAAEIRPSWFTVWTPGALSTGCTKRVVTQVRFFFHLLQRN